MTMKLPILPRGWGRGLPVAAAKPVDVSPEMSLADFMPDRPADRDPGLGRRLMPSTVEGILRNALAGDLRDQQRLFAIMCDTWPVLSDCMRSRRDAAKSADWCVHPQESKDDTVKAEAQLRADVVERALWGMLPRVTELEIGGEGLLSELAAGTAEGHKVIELRWESRAEERLNGGTWVLPRACRVLGPQWWRWSSTGADRLIFTGGQHGGSAAGTAALPDQHGGPLGTAALPGGPRGTAALPEALPEALAGEWPENKCLIQISKAHGGHPSEAALLRVLAKYWLAGTFGFEWLLKYAQLFGAPFRVAYYDKGSKNVLGKIMAMLDGLGAAGYGAFPAGTKIEWLEAARAAGELPQKLVSEIADTACRIVLTGQTLATSQSTEGGGTYAQSKTHSAMRDEVLQAMLDEIAGTLSGQFVRSVLLLNFGDTRLAPELRVEREEASETPKEKAERDRILIEAGVEIPKAYFYDRHGIPIPAEGEATVGRSGDGGSKGPQIPQISADSGGADQQAQDKEEEDPDYEAVATAAARGGELPLLGEVTRLALERGLAAGRRSIRREMRAAERAEQSAEEEGGAAAQAVRLSADYAD